MPTTTIAGRDLHVNEEGFLTQFDEWDREVGAALAHNIGIDLTDEHWELLTWLRDDFRERGETATSRRVQTGAGIPIKRQFQLFPKKPAKKMAYVAGLPKPKGCV